MSVFFYILFFFFQAEDGIRDLVRSRGLGDVYKRQPLKKDGSNLEEVFLLLNNAEYVDAMADRAYRDVIASGNYSYKEFVRFVDGEIESLSNQLSRTRQARCVDGAAKIRLPELSSITTMPIQALPPTPAQLRSLLRRVAIFTWGKVPELSLIHI